MHKEIAWDDLQYILAVATHGSLAGAARALQVNHTTVLRRVTTFEERQGLRLFDRLPSGYTLTAGGEELVAAARAVQEVVTDLERRLAGQDLRLQGSLRVTTTDTLMASLLPDVIAGFHAAHPGVDLEISTSNVIADLTRRDADVAIRPTRNPPEVLVGRRVATIAYAIYASPNYLHDTTPGAPMTAHRWLAPDDSLTASSIARWMRAALPGATVALRANSLTSLRQAALSGLGAVVLPCYLGDATPGLVRVCPTPIEGLSTALWILTHEDLRRTARVAAFIDFAARRLDDARPVLEGGRALVSVLPGKA